MSQPLKERVAIIVGSSSGMGRATAITFAAAGAKVILAARGAEALQTLVEEIGENVETAVADLGDANVRAALCRCKGGNLGRPPREGVEDRGFPAVGQADYCYFHRVSRINRSP